MEHDLARVVLGLQEVDVLTPELIRSSFNKEVRRCHPDSPKYVVSSEDAGVRI